MDIKDIPKSVIALSIGVIIVIAMIPIFGDYNSILENKDTNTGGQLVSVYDTTSDYDLDISYDVTNHTVTGVTSTQGAVIVMSDNFAIALSKTSTFWFLAYKAPAGGQFYALTSSDTAQPNVTAIDITKGDEGQISMEFTGGTLGPFTFDYTYFAVTDDNGAYIYGDYANTTKDVLLNSVNDAYFLYYGGGNLANIVNGVATYNGEEATIYDDSTKVKGMTDLYSLTLGTDLGVSYNDQDYVAGKIIVPVEVISHTEVNSATLSIIGLIPLLLIVALVIGAIGIISMKKE